MTASPNRHKCPVETLDYSQVSDGLITCIECGRYWKLKFVEFKTDDESEEAKGKWQWFANPKFPEQIASERQSSGIAKKRAIQANMAKKKGYTGTRSRSGGTLPRSRTVRRADDERNGAPRGAGPETSASEGSGGSSTLF